MNPPLEELTTIRTRRKAHFIFDSTKWKWFTDFGEFCGQNHNPSNKGFKLDKASRTSRSKVQAETRYLVCQESCYNYALVYFWTCLLSCVNSCDPSRGIDLFMFCFPNRSFLTVSKQNLTTSTRIHFFFAFLLNPFYILKHNSPNLHKKTSNWRTWRILVGVVEWRHHAIVLCSPANLPLTVS